MKLLIDAGHGGEDFGARHNGIVEKDISLAVAKELYRILKMILDSSQKSLE